MKEIVRENGSIWLDTKGEPIHAHGGIILKHLEYYYWYGEDRRSDFYVSCYRSKDLVEWEFRNHILTTKSVMSPIRIRTNMMLKNESDKKVNLERPKIIYNKKTKKFVLWVHFENGEDYTAAAVALATCDEPDGDFIYHGHFNPYGYMSRDCTLFVDKNETAYFISASRDNADLHVYRLSEDYMNVDALIHKLWQGEYREAPAIIEKDEEYFMLTSFCTGWEPNQAKYAVANGIESKWSELVEIGDSTSYGSQPTFLLEVNNQLLYFGDRWQGDGSAYFSSGYTVYPIIKEKNNWTIKQYDEVIFNQDGVYFK